MDSQYKGQERRKNARAMADFPVLYDVDPQIKVRLTIKRKIFNAISINICEFGMSVLTNVDLPIDVSAYLDFTLFNIKEADSSKKTKRIEVNCKTRYSLPAPDGAYKVGLQFIGLLEEDHRFIAKYIKDSLGAKK